MLIEIDGRELHFQAISRTGRTIDAGTLYKDGDAASQREQPQLRIRTAGPFADCSHSVLEDTDPFRHRRRLLERATRLVEAGA